ncbi:hypothetical protein N7462_001604 [Penicillium macrosclerotiorum]|uniref:uncharacterized protein n=1 Tax=Penicillium macrosclerotiorum TaxID=303699 RepID=UPI002548E4DA|nr:uncharacterized protein N7462_001604 [Penicillium macrosclerotiorum]KAJ5692181.1 hypothetical protein N7462_001604 [Penicillium macrosclerotiorum]
MDAVSLGLGVVSILYPIAKAGLDLQDLDVHQEICALHAFRTLVQSMSCKMEDTLHHEQATILHPDSKAAWKSLELEAQIWSDDCERYVFGISHMLRSICSKSSFMISGHRNKFSKRIRLYQRKNSKEDLIKGFDLIKGRHDQIQESMKSLLEINRTRMELFSAPQQNTVSVNMLFWENSRIKKLKEIKEKLGSSMECPGGKCFITGKPGSGKTQICSKFAEAYQDQ